MKIKLSSIIKDKGTYFLTEYFIVVVGILSAFSLNAWWESRKTLERESAYYGRIQIEIDQADQNLERSVSRIKDTLRAVLHVYDRLSQGVLVDGDAELFDLGLLKADQLPAIRYPVPTYQELRNTGAFNELTNDSLKNILSEIHLEFQFADAQLEYYRVGLEAAKATLNQHVSFSVQEPENENSSWFSVSYDFEDLMGNELLRNQFVEVIDSHYDWLTSVEALHSLVRKYQKTTDPNGS